MIGAFGIFGITQDVFAIEDIVQLEGQAPDERKLKEFNTFVKVWNIALTTLGYLPGVSIISGSIRMLGGACVAIGSCFNSRMPDSFNEKLLTIGVAQIGRGALEAFIPFGHLCNIVLDIVCTFIAIPKKELTE